MINNITEQPRITKIQKQFKIKKYKNNNYNFINSPDMRCCGICYYYFIHPTYNSKYNCCMRTIDEHMNSGYIITNDIMNTFENFCTYLCLPIKLALFLPCHLGVCINSSINYFRGIDANYIC